MRLPALSFLLLSAAFLAAAADNPSFTGKWQVHTSVAGNESDSACTFTQKDSELTGSCASDQGTLPVTGKVDGKTATWAFKVEYGGNPLTVTYKGTIDEAGKIAGSVMVEEMGIGGDFTATAAAK
jgi:hypothetical protein